MEIHDVHSAIIPDDLLSAHSKKKLDPNMLIRSKRLLQLLAAIVVLDLLHLNLVVCGGGVEKLRQVGYWDDVPLSKLDP